LEKAATVELEVGTREALGERFAAAFESAARAALTARGRFACAVPGGSVARTFFPRLVRAAVEWPRLHVFFSDERAVPVEHPDSNLGLARQLWLDHVSVDPAHVHPLYRPGRELEEIAAEAERELVSALGDPPRLDLALLGMGADGHVGSLFPGHPRLAERGWVLALSDAPKPPRERVTLGLAALAQAREIVVAAFGAEKAAAVQQALEAPASQLPVALALRSGPPVRMLLDPGAAGRLSGR
jgi:6-phosphogluconolactonase